MSLREKSQAVKKINNFDTFISLLPKREREEAILFLTEMTGPAYSSEQKWIEKIVAKYPTETPQKSPGYAALLMGKVISSYGVLYHSFLLFRREAARTRSFIAYDWDRGSKSMATTKKSEVIKDIQNQFSLFSATKRDEKISRLVMDDYMSKGFTQLLKYLPFYFEQTSLFKTAVIIQKILQIEFSKKKSMKEKTYEI